MRPSAGTESEAVVRKLFFIYGSQFLCDCLLDYPVYHCGYPQFPCFSFLLFGYFYPSDWVWLVFAFPHLLDQFGLVFSQVG